MIIAVLLSTPLLLAVISFLLKSEKAGKILLMLGAVINAACVVCAWCNYDLSLTLGSLYLAIDDYGIMLLTVTAILFFFCSLYLLSWFTVDAERSDGKSVMKQSTFVACLLIFLFTMSLTAVVRDMGMLWVAVEATTLSSAPLIHYRKGKASLEAMWKYLLICSIGIGLALFGTMLIAASLHDPHGSLDFYRLRDALQNISAGQLVWFKAGFVLCFAGYALKMGLAPFHTWLPDAYSEAPAPVSALLSGSLINYAFLAILRLLEITPRSLSDFSAGYLKFFGFFSLAVAAFFIIRQKDFKRMLAYSSVEHMGIIALFISYSMFDIAALHIYTHSMMKMILFIVAGNILLAYGTRTVNEVHGLFKKAPVNAALWVFGILLICGTPPSPLFITEFFLVRGAGIISGAAILILLFLIFAGMTNAALKMCAADSKTSAAAEVDGKVEKLAIIPIIATVLVAVAGAWLLAFFWFM